MTACVVHFPKPREPEPYGSYKDWLRANRKSREWLIQPTPKQPGDIVIGGQRVEVHP